MADSSPVSPELTENESPAQKQARLRRERRNAKLQTGGNDRLNKIMGVSGRTAAQEMKAEAAAHAQPSPYPDTRPAPPPAQRSFQAFDPDMSDPFGTPGDSNVDPMMRMMQQMMMAQQAGPQAGQQNAAPPAMAPQDPMRLLQQMMSGAQAQDGQQPGAPPAMGQEDPMKLLQQMMAGAQVQEEQQAAPPNSTNLWRIVHAVFAIVLALYVGLATPFTGTKIARAESQLVDDSLKGAMATKLFLLFATFELVLQSTRYFLEKGQLPPSGIIGTLTQFLPQPWGGYLRTVGRYSIIYTTISADALVVVFVLGVLAWWNETGT